MSKSTLPSSLQFFNRYINDDKLESVCRQDTGSVMRFNLCINRLTCIGMLYLSRSNLDCLKDLFLNGNAIGGMGCKYLLRANLPNLERLCIQRNNIESTGMLHLSKAFMPKIREISLVYNKIGRNGSLWLAKTRWKAGVEILLPSNELREYELLLFLLYPQNLLSYADYRYNKITPQEKDRLNTVFALKYRAKIHF